MTLSCDVTSSAQRRDKILFKDRISSVVVVEDGSTVSLSLLGNGAEVWMLQLLSNDTYVGVLL